MHRVARIRGRAPLGIVDGQIACLLAHRACLLAQDAARALRKLRLGIVAGLAERVRRVMVRADEVGRQPVARAEAGERLHPGIRGGGRATDFQPAIDGLDRFRRVSVEFEIVVLLAAAERGQIGFVPDFKKPLPHFVDAVPADPVAHQFADQHRPLRVVLRRRDIGAVVEYRLVAGCERGRHEAQFDERPHADRQQKIEDLIGIGERIEEFRALADQRAHVVRQDAMEAHVLHAEVVVRPCQLCAPVGAQAQGRMAAPDRVLPEMRQRRRWPKQAAVEARAHDNVTRLDRRG